MPSPPSGHPCSRSAFGPAAFLRLFWKIAGIPTFKLVLPINSQNQGKTTNL
ncbi:hypothetical protein APV28_0331 [Comamonas testosteroni]|nr:hypothetical protein APV28_0331 [Comamonas testosteroni]